MSLDVYLCIEDKNKPVYRDGLLVKNNGVIHEITLAEWQVRFPGYDPEWSEFVDGDKIGKVEVYSANITHNLGKMASEAGVYEALWRPAEKDYRLAKQLIDPLQGGLARLQASPEYYKTFNPSNGWGSYDALVSFVRRYIKACEEYPNAEISVSR